MPITLKCTKCARNYIYKNGTTKKLCMKCYQRWRREILHKCEIGVLQEIDLSYSENTKLITCEICQHKHNNLEYFAVCKHINYDRPIILCKCCCQTEEMT